MSIQEALITMFTDDPINWLKWAIVFAVLIGGYAVAVPLYKKVSHGVSWERKRDIAKSRDHVIKTALADKHPTGEVSRYDWHATYHYTIDGEERQYTAYFKHPSTPPLYLYLYYVDDPDKLFSCEEYHYENHKAILLLPVIFLPWILACIALVLLGVDLSGFCKTYQAPKHSKEVCIVRDTSLFLQSAGYPRRQMAEDRLSISL